LSPPSGLVWHSSGSYAEPGSSFQPVVGKCGLRRCQSPRLWADRTIAVTPE
jgi:hypothetical protein